ncbi:DUF2807 domain-containing protein [bacterium]|nr:DUF2807 domain-containing protein [bacterium]
MKTFLTTEKFSFAAALLIMLTSCNFVVAQRGITSEERTVSTFKAVVTKGSEDLYVTQGNEQKVRIEAEEGIIKDIETNVRGGVLYVEHEDRYFTSHKKIKVYVTMKEITGLKLSGSGSIVGETPIKTNELELGISGSGDITLDVTATEINSGISGSGNIDLSGKTSDHNFKISGSGKINAMDLNAENCTIQISGAGDAKVNVSKQLDVKISGSGSIRYAGNPDKVNTNVSGSGSVQKM